MEGNKSGLESLKANGLQFVNYKPVYFVSELAEPKPFARRRMCRPERPERHEHRTHKGCSSTL